MTERQSQNPEITEVLNKFSLLADRLLKPALQHTEVWKSATYQIPEEQKGNLYDELVSSELADLIKDHTDPYTDETYSTETPDRIYILAEDFDHLAHPIGHKWTNLELGLTYAIPNDGFNDIKIAITIGESKATGYVFSTKYMETGYEGHDHKTQELSLGQLQKLYDLIDKNATVPTEMSAAIK